MLLGKRSSSITRKRYTVYCDGACNKQGVGGAGAFIIEDGIIKCAISFRQNNTTNNQMELSAAIIGLSMFRALSEGTNACVELKTDSQYVQKGITQWIYNWIKKGWKSSSGDVLNKEIWQKLFKLTNDIKNSNRPVDIQWVKGHAGHAGNEVADHLASKIFTEDSKYDSSLKALKVHIEKYYTDNDEVKSSEVENFMVIHNNHGNSCLLNSLDDFMELV